MHSYNTVSIHKGQQNTKKKVKSELCKDNHSITDLATHAPDDISGYIICSSDVSAQNKRPGNQSESVKQVRLHHNPSTSGMIYCFSIATKHDYIECLTLRLHTLFTTALIYLPHAATHFKCHTVVQISQEFTVKALRVSGFEVGEVAQ